MSSLAYRSNVPLKIRNDSTVTTVQVAEVLRIPVRVLDASVPGVKGDVVHNLNDNSIYHYDGTTWSIISGATHSIPQYHLIAGGPGDTLVDVSPGVSNQILVSQGSSALPMFEDLSNVGVSSVYANGGTHRMGNIQLVNGTAISITNTGNDFTISITGQSSTNTSFGSNALNVSIPHSENTAYGAQALQSLTVGDDNTAVGYKALQTTVNGISNTAAGAHALENLANGSRNSAYGHLALRSCVTVSDLSAFGYAALQDATSGQSSAFGSGALQHSSSTNDAFGTNALNALTTGGANAAFGYNTLRSATTSQNNVAMGTQAGSNLIGGGNHVLLGYSAGTGYTNNEQGNIIIGAGVAGTANENRVLRIGSTDVFGLGRLDAAYIAGIRGVTTGQSNAVAVLIDSNGQLGTVNSSKVYKDCITDMSDYAVLQLRPRNFVYKVRPNVVERGLIAEEVEKVIPDLVAYNNDGTPMSVKYHELPVLLLAEMQKMTKKIDMLERRIAQLESQA